MWLFLIEKHLLYNEFNVTSLSTFAFHSPSFLSSNSDINHLHLHPSYTHKHTHTHARVRSSQSNTFSQPQTPTWSQHWTRGFFSTRATLASSRYIVGEVPRKWKSPLRETRGQGGRWLSARCNAGASELAREKQKGRERRGEWRGSKGESVT